MCVLSTIRGDIIKRLLGLFLCAVLALCSCSSMPNLDNVDYQGEDYLYDFPEDIAQLCYIAKQDAKNCLMEANPEISFPQNYQCRVEQISGTKRFGTIWGWYDDQYFNTYVLGLCSGPVIKVGCSPYNTSDVSYSVLKHEFGHHWLICRYYEYGHNPMYRSCFVNWYGSKTFEVIKAKDGGAYVGQSVTRDELKFITVEFIDKDGNPVHIDMVQEIE